IEWKETKQGMTILLPQVVGKYEEKGDEDVKDLVAHVTEALSIMNQDYTLNQMEKHIYPVIRSTSFPTETKEGKNLITREHTAETRIFYAIDLGKSYRLIEEALLNEEGWNEERLHEHELFNLRALSCDYKKKKQFKPDISSTYIPTETKEGKNLITREHTAETRIFYAIDLGKSYRLIEEALLNEEGWNEERLHEHALFNLRALSCDYKKDQV